MKIKIESDIFEVVKKSFIALLIRALGFLSGYLFIFLTVKYFGPEVQGRLSLSFSFMIIGSLVCRLGVDVSFVKIFAINDNFENSKGIYFKILPDITLLSLISSSFVFFLSDTISENIFNDIGLSPYLKWTSPCIFFFTIVLVNSGVFRGLKKNSLYSFLFNGGRFFFTFISFCILTFFWKDNPQTTVISHTISIFILFVISIYYIKKYIYPFTNNTSYKKRRFIVDSLPMLLSASMIIFLGWTDTIVLGIYKESSLVGIYNVVLKVATVVSFTLQAIDSILAPKLSMSFHDQDYTKFKKLIKFSTILNIMISSTVVLFIVLFKSQILEIFGEEFTGASTALIILSIGQLFNSIFGPIGSIFQMTGHQKTFQNILFVSVVVNLILNLILVKDYGINGVAASTSISLILSKILGVIYIRKTVWKQIQS